MDVKDGPVLCMLNKRVRGLRKKYNRILQIEESKSQGKLINKEQEDVLKSKASVAALLDEYDKLRHPLSAALEEEFAARHGDQGSNPAGDNPQDAAALSDDAIAELLKIMYFAHLFDVRSQKDYASMMWTRMHERSSCLSYDYVTDDATNPLGDGDLDALALFGSLMVSRPPNATLSHRAAILDCVRHARQWLLSSDRPIHPDLPLSYSDLRERLNRILSSEYFTTTPELQTVSQQTAAAAATAAGQYVTQVLASEASAEGPVFQTEDASTYFPLKDQNGPEHHFYQTEEYSSAPADGGDQSDSTGEGNSSLSYIAENNASFELPQSEISQIPLNLSPAPVQHECHPQLASHSRLPLQKQEQPLGEACQDHDQEVEDCEQQLEPEHKEQHQQQLETEHKEHQQLAQNGGTFRGYQGQKGVRGVGGRGRGYINGRGGRGSRGGSYSNGRGHYHEQGNYYPRNYRSGRGRVGRGGGVMYNHHSVGTSQSSATAGGN